MDSALTSEIERYLQLEQQGSATQDDWERLSERAQEQLLKGENIENLFTIGEKGALFRWVIYKPRQRFRRLILEKAVDEAAFLLHYNTDYDHMEDAGDVVMLHSKTNAPIPANDELNLMVGDYLLDHLKQAIREHVELKVYVESRIPKCIVDMANLFFDCNIEELSDKKPCDFSRIPLFQKARTQPLKINPRWNEIVEDIFFHSLMKDMRKLVLMITKIAALDSFHPLVHAFEDWAHRRLFHHGEPEVKRWLKDVYKAKYDLLSRIEYGRADERGTKANTRWQNMVSQKTEQGKKDFQYFAKVQDILNVRMRT